MLHSIIIVLLFWLTYALGLVIGWYIPEKLVKPWGLFDMKPFDCRKCMTFWSLLLSYISFTVLLHNIYFLSCGILITIATTYCLIYTEREKMTDEEDKKEADRDFFIE